MEALKERWPSQARLFLNRAAGPTNDPPLSNLGYEIGIRPRPAVQRGLDRVAVLSGAGRRWRRCFG